MYNYHEAVKADIREYIRQDINLANFDSWEELEDHLNDELWTADSVTGNASGSYTFSYLKAREYVLDNVDLVGEMVDAFGITAGTVCEKFLYESWEWFDVSIRCYLLAGCIRQVIDELKEEYPEKE